MSWRRRSPSRHRSRSAKSDNTSGARAFRSCRGERDVRKSWLLLIRSKQGKRGDVIVDRRLAHELLHSVDRANAQSFCALARPLFQTAFNPVEAELLALTFSFQHSS